MVHGAERDTLRVVKRVYMLHAPRAMCRVARAGWCLSPDSQVPARSLDELYFYTPIF